MTGTSSAYCGCIKLISFCAALTILSGATSIANAGEAALTQDVIPQDQVTHSDPGVHTTDPVTYSVRIYKEPNRIKLKGEISSQEDYQTLIGLVKANFPSINLTDRVKVTQDSSETGVKIGGLSYALKVLGYVENGQATYDNNGLHLVGSADTATVLDEVRKLVLKDKPEGVAVKNLTVTAPELSWRIQLREGQTIRISGVVKSAKMKDELRSRLRQLFPLHTIIDTSSVNEKLPDHWPQSIEKSIELLTYLEHGLIDVTAASINVKGHSASEGMLSLLVSASKNLPSKVAVNSEVTAPKRETGFRQIGSVSDVTVPLPIAPN